MNNSEDEMLVEIAPDLQDAVDGAILRAAYLFPQVSFERAGNGVKISGLPPSDAPKLKKEFSYLVYREHIRRRFEHQRRRALERLYG